MEPILTRHVDRYVATLVVVVGGAVDSGGGGEDGGSGGDGTGTGTGAAGRVQHFESKICPLLVGTEAGKLV